MTNFNHFDAQGASRQVRHAVPDRAPPAASAIAERMASRAIADRSGSVVSGTGCLTWRLGLTTALVIIGLSASAAEPERERPNILWLIAEDFGPHLGCYGTEQVWTPNLDRLAAEGVRYTRFFTTAPVCSPSRSAWMTGMYQTTIGAHNHRSHRDDSYRLRDGVRLLTDWMRDTGYFTANVRELTEACGFRGTGKTDWNFSYEGAPFDSDRWRDLKPHQPFFAQVNFQETHRAFHAPRRADPARVEIPPYYPDHPVTRSDWAAYLDAASELDHKIGLVLEQLKADDLLESTVVVFFADNGQAHVRGKQFCYDSGLQVPLIIRWPKRFAVPEHFRAGWVDERLISAIDLAPTMLDIAGAGAPATMEGQIFLGPRADEPRQYAFGARDRCDETVFRFRTVRDARYRYIRNFTHERPFLQANGYKERSYPVWSLLKELHAQGKLTPAQAALCAPRMHEEELYDTEHDPHEIHNLVQSSEHREILQRLREALTQWIDETNDQGRDLEPPELAARKGVIKPTTNPNTGYTLDGQPPQPAKSARPNILFIFSDDHAYQAISAYGDPRKLLETPNIDRIARQGMRFDRCLVTNSICGPSRATILTGKYSHANGFYNNSNSRFDGSQVTFPRLLRAAGYQTALIGKWHLVTEPVGFDYWHILPGQGVYYNPPMIEMGQKLEHAGYTTDIITDLSLEWLKRRDRGKPFLLMCQHKAPHREWEPALRHLAHDGDRRYPEPETLFDDYAGRGRAEREQDMTIARTMTPRDLKLTPPPQLTSDQRMAWDAYYEPRNEALRRAGLKGEELVRWKYNRYLHDYLGCIKAVDESIGRLLTYLDENGLGENTIVVYSSDQGFFLGEHGWFDKRWIFEESLRTPLLIRWPGVVQPGSTSGELVSNLDFAETFLEAAGVAVPDEMQGRSLVPILEGQTPSDWRKSFYYHFCEFPGVHAVRRHYGVVTDRYKLVRFYEADVDYWELFDLHTDPRELTSVYGRPNYGPMQHHLEEELARLRRELKVPEADAVETTPQPRRAPP